MYVQKSRMYARNRESKSALERAAGEPRAMPALGSRAQVPFWIFDDMGGSRFGVTCASSHLCVFGRRSCQGNVWQAVAFGLTLVDDYLP